MRVIWLIALREYIENVRTRGFWLGVLLIPVIFAGIFLFSARLAENAPVRHYVLIDQSGQYEEAVASAIRREHQRRILQSFTRYIQQYRRPDADLPSVSADQASSQIDRFLNDAGSQEIATLDQWLSNGGLDNARQMAEPYLRDDAPPFEAPREQFVAVPPPEPVDPTASPEQIVEQMRPWLNDEQRLRVDGESVRLFALILIPDGVEEQIMVPGSEGLQPRAEGEGVQFWTGNLTDTRLPNAIEASINRNIREQAFAERGIDVSAVQNIQRMRLPLTRLDPGQEEGEESVSMADTFRQWAPIGFVYLIFISLMQSVQYLLSNTIEEKSNRIIEVLIASVTPNELMMGKLVGIGMSGITTIIAWLLSFFVFIRLYQSVETAMIAQVLDVLLGSDLIPWFIFYYLSGYALYAGIFLAIGSLCNTLKEAQSLMMPLMLILIIPIISMGFIAQDPNGTLARVMSWIPLFTPFSMMNRAAAQPPVFDLIGTSLLLLASVVLVLWLSGRVFRQGVLRTGQPPRLLELWRMMRARPS
ncbi:MAG: ABC transporter permease [Pseudohongiellaceae bacterium]